MTDDKFQTTEGLAEARESLERIQGFEVKELVQSQRLGFDYDFQDAVAPAEKLVEMFSQIPLGSLDLLPTSELKKIREQSDAVFNLFEQILNFDLEGGDVRGRRDALIAQLWNKAQPTFVTLMPYVAFAMAKTVDFGALETKARASLQAIRDRTDEISKEMEDAKVGAEETLAEVRKTAAEIGVTQEAKHFSREAEQHEVAAGRWLIASICAVLVLSAYAVFSFFLHKIDTLAPSTTYEIVQISIAKVLMLGVLFYVVAQCVRSYVAHKHNAVTNKHRQNALMTYKTLTEAGATSDTRDAVLQHAAAAIYSPNDSGYIQNEERGYNGSPVLNMPRLFQQSSAAEQ